MASSIVFIAGEGGRHIRRCRCRRRTRTVLVRPRVVVRFDVMSAGSGHRSGFHGDDGDDDELMLAAGG